jgi:large subunit ribosomal protein L3
VSEKTEGTSEAAEKAPAKKASSEHGSTADVQLDGIYAFKVGMTTVYDEAGNAIAVTVLRQGQWVVSQVKTEANDGYTAVQVACEPKAVKNASKAAQGHFGKSGFKTDFDHVFEVRQPKVDGVVVGSKVALDSLKKGDIVKVTSRSKGRGFQGSVKRYGFGGGPAAHGSKFHRQPGSGGNRTWPARVMPGKRYPGHMGDRFVTIPNVKIIDVIPEENVVLVSGPVPGAPNGVVRVMKDN